MRNSIRTLITGIVPNIAVALLIGDQTPNWQIKIMLLGGFLMTIATLTYDRFQFQPDEPSGFLAQLILYVKHLGQSGTLVPKFRTQDDIASLKIPLVFHLPTGLLVLLVGCGLEAAGLRPGGWALVDYGYWILLTGLAIIGVLIYAYCTTDLRAEINVDDLFRTAADNANV